MSARIINLRRARKDSVRKKREADAEANRRRFGQTRAEKARQAAADELAARTLGGHRREIDGQKHRDET